MLCLTSFDFCKYSHPKSSKEEESPREYWLAIAYATGIELLKIKFGRRVFS